MSDPRIQELAELAQAEGFTLALPPERIAELEDAGNVVCLLSGDIIGCANDWFALTPEYEIWYLQMLCRAVEKQS